MLGGIWKNAKGLSVLRRTILSEIAQENEDKIEKHMKLISGGIIGNSNYIGTRLNGLVQEVKSKGKKPIQFFPENIHK